jgi:hypothetical protein
MTINIDPNLIDAVRAAVFPGGALGSCGSGEHGGRAPMGEDGERHYIKRLLTTAARLEAVKSSSHPNVAKTQCREVLEELLTASGA